ncbi:MAG: methyltransferase domain-containing protein [Candidatus Bathyarchaeota archaeon]|nr:methyltransferase domain-containing protein [Candidatus Bathyarchaeota archaeon]
MSTIDWEEHWAKREEQEEVTEFNIKLAERLRRFIRDKPIKTVADYGCGPATIIFSLAQAFPSIFFNGYDSAASVIEKNREKARNLPLGKIHFEQDALPLLSGRKKYDIVLCFATLHYVEDIKEAIMELYDRVESGGYLFFNYPSLLTMREYRRRVKPGDLYMRRRFALLLAGRNLLSLRRIREILGVKPRKFYSSTRTNIYVSCRKR